MKEENHIEKREIFDLIDIPDKTIKMITENKRENEKILKEAIDKTINKMKIETVKQMQKEMGKDGYNKYLKDKLYNHIYEIANTILKEKIPGACYIEIALKKDDRRQEIIKNISICDIDYELCKLLYNDVVNEVIDSLKGDIEEAKIREE